MEEKEYNVGEMHSSCIKGTKVLDNAWKESLGEINRGTASDCNGLSQIGKSKKIGINHEKRLRETKRRAGGVGNFSIRRGKNRRKRTDPAR